MYHSLVAALSAVCTLDVEDQRGVVIALRHPDALRCLLAAALLCVEHVERRPEKQVEQRACGAESRRDTCYFFRSTGTR